METDFVTIRLPLPQWCNNLDKRTKGAIIRFCKYDSINPEQLNNWGIDDFMKVRGIGKKTALDIILARDWGFKNGGRKEF